MLRSLASLTFCLFAWFCLAQAPYIQSAASKSQIVSPTHPVDSLGETVYEAQGKDQLAVPVVPGIYSDPAILKKGKLKYSPAMKKAKYHGFVTVYAVITSSGSVVDVEVEKPADPDAEQAAVQAVEGYRFRPATLDGKPVAIRFKTVVEFKIY